MNLASVSLSVKHRAVRVALRIRKGHIREAMTSSCMNSLLFPLENLAFIQGETHGRVPTSLKPRRLCSFHLHTLVSESSPPGGPSSTASPSSRLHSGLTHPVQPLRTALVHAGALVPDPKYCLLSNPCSCGYRSIINVVIDKVIISDRGK